MKIPKEIDERLYDDQRQEIRKRIKRPTAVLFNDASMPWVSRDPDWKKVDDLLNASNLVLNLTKRAKSGDLDFTVHEILPGVHVIRIADDWVSSSPGTYAGEVILINAADLKSIREGGMAGLMLATLLRDF